MTTISDQKKASIELVGNLIQQVITLCVAVIGSLVAALKIFDVKQIEFGVGAYSGLLLLFSSVLVGVLCYGRLISLCANDKFRIDDCGLRLLGVLQQAAFIFGVLIISIWLIRENSEDPVIEVRDIEAQQTDSGGITDNSKRSRD